MKKLFLTLLIINFSWLCSTAEFIPHLNTAPVAFLENKGQWDNAILYKSNSTSGNVYLLKDGLSFSQMGIVDEEKEQHTPFLVWNMKFISPDPNLQIEGKSGKQSVYSYLWGNDPSKWIIHPQSFQSVNYNHLYKNIDLKYYGNGSHLEYDFVLHKGSNIKDIKVFYEGANKLYINSKEDLEISTPWNTQIQKAPVAWQLINDIKIPVKVNYILINDSTFGFTVRESYNKNYDLIIDPLFEMVWSSYTNILGVSNNMNYCFASNMDNNGNVYLTGMVDDTYPITAGAYSGPNNVQPEVFVAKFSSDGTTLLYWTYLPGNSSEHGTGIAIDDLGRAYITGIVDLNFTGLTTFPSTPNAYQPVHADGSDAFLSVLSADGSSLIYSTFIGGDGSETGYDISVGPPGIAYVTGTTSHAFTGVDFPLVATTVFPTSDNNAFVCKFDINQSGVNSLIYSTKIGAGSFNSVKAKSIAVNSAGNAFITGSVYDGGGTFTFPVTTGAYSNIYNSGQDNIMSYVTKLSATTPVTLSYSTLLAPGIANAIAVDDATGDAFIAGSTYTFAFPVTAGALQTTHAGVGGTDAFAIRLNSTGSSLVYSTFLGGNQYDEATGIAVNSAGEAYVTGIADAQFPTSTGSYQPLNAGSEDFFVVNINAAGTGYACGGSTYIGGNDEDYSGSFYDYSSPQIAIKDHGGNNDTICISSTSHSQDFPTTPGVFGPIKVNSIADQPVFFKMTCAINIPPEVNFNQSIIQSCSSVVVNMTDSTINNPTSWVWYFPGASPDTSTLQNPQGIIYTTSGLHSIKLVACNAYGCDSLTINIQVNVSQNIPVSLGNDTAVCIGNNVTLTTTSGYSNYSWQLNGNNIGTNLPSLNATQQGTYTLLITDTLGCTGSDTINVTMNSPAVTLASDVHLCNNDSALVIASNGNFNYQWLVNGNTLPFTEDSIYVAQQGNFVVVVTDSIGCTDRDTLTVTVNNPVVTIGQNIILCNDDSVLVAATSGYSSYQWTINGNTITAISNSYYANQTGNLIVAVSDSIGCIARDTISVSQSNPTVTLGSDIILCNNDSTLLTATPGYPSYQWAINGNSLPSSTNSIYASQAGDYIVAITDSSGCIDSDTLSIILSSAASIISQQDINICVNDSVLISATAGYSSYQWSLNGNALPLNVNSIYANQQGNYIVSVTDTTGCLIRDSVLITVNSPFVTIGSDVVLCNNDSVLITATPGFSVYQWVENGNTLSSNTNAIYATQPGLYMLTVADSIGCTTSDTLSSDTSTVFLSLMNDTSFCSGDSVMIITPAGFASYQWQLNNNNISTSNSITINQTGNYFLTITNAQGCTAEDHVDVTVNPLPIIQTINNAVVCKGNNITLTTTGAANYIWDPATYLSSTTDDNPVSTPLNAITYTVTGTDSNGCSATENVNIQVGDSTIAMFDFSTQINCEGIELRTDNQSLNATNYKWIFGDGSSSSEINPVHYFSSSQNQTVQLIASGGNCADTTEIENLLFPPGEFHFTPNSFTPNNDGRNDCYQLQGIENLSDCFSISFFNRWGELIHQSDDIYNCWDGKKNDKDLPEGVYLYVVSIRKDKFIGTVNLIR